MLAHFIAAQLPKPLTCYKVGLTNVARSGSHRWRCQSLQGAKALEAYFVEMGCTRGESGALDECEPIWICFSEAEDLWTPLTKMSATLGGDQVRL